MEPRAGGSWERVLTTSLTRAQIVEYAGASGDFNPIHIDEPYATEQCGLPSVIAPGMLTLAMTLDAIGRVFGETSIVSVHARFLKPVFPGDELVARFESAEPEVLSGTTLPVNFSTHRPGQLVVQGSVSVANPRLSSE
jgi:acyl dehydratase